MQTKPNTFFSEGEISLLYDTGLYPLKRSATEKLYRLFANLIPALKDTAIHKEFSFPEGTDVTTGRISKGENHQSYPWVVLDFPAKFSRESIFCVRNMFWFGHYFSTSLILSGTAMQPFIDNFFKNYQSLYRQDICFSMHTDPWKHEVAGPYYVLLDTLDESNMRRQADRSGYVKLSHRFIHTEPEEIAGTALKYYELMLGAVS